MVYSLKKIQMAIATLVLATTGSLLANDDSSASYQEAGVPDACVREASVPEACSSDCCSCGQFFVDASLLYLRAFEGGLSSACDSTHIIDTDEDGLIISRLTGKGHDPDFRWDLGFRIGAG